ncbi:MAG: nuclear transport factor 2 family protein, partial [Chloroflexota bacterium]|nr:nuclear transport factor 2 family protein [Chloroflexota bacterium]
FNAHDVAAIVALYADNAELFDSGMKRPRHGRNEIEQWFTTRFRTIPTITYKPHRLIVEDNQGGQAADTWTTHGHGPRLLRLPLFTRSFHIDGVSIFTLRDGHIQQQRGYYDHLSVLEQLLPFLKWLLPRRL